MRSASGLGSDIVLCGMAADMEIQARLAIRPTRVFTRAELKNCADLDRECRKQLGDFAETYARALLAGVWLALEWESQEAWSASVLTGVKLDKLARERVAAELAEAGKTTREIAAATGVSQPTAIADVQAARDKELDHNASPRQQAARGRERARKAAREAADQAKPVDAAPSGVVPGPVDAAPSGNGQAVSLGVQTFRTQAETPGAGVQPPWPVQQPPLPAPCARCAEKDRRITELARQNEELAEQLRLALAAQSLPADDSEFDPMYIP